MERLGELPDGRLTYALNKPHKSDRTHLILTPLQLLQRLSALIPPPFVHGVRFHGVVASASPHRAAVVPAPRKTDRHGRPHRQQGEGTEPKDEAKPPSSRVPWAELVRRIYGADAMACARCGGRLSWIALIVDPPVVRKILTHLGLPTEPPSVSPARDPPWAE